MGLVAPILSSRALMLVALAGCDQVYGLPDRDNDDEIGLDCAGGPIAIDDGFDGAEACQPWGEPFANSSEHLISVSGSSLVIVTDKPGAAGCTSDQPMPFPRAMIIEVSSVIDIQDGYTFMAAGFDDTVKASESSLRYENNNATQNYSSEPWDATAARYWRLEQRGEYRVASYSADATEWIEIGRRHVPIDNVVLGLVAGLISSSSSTTPTKIDRLVVCE